MSVRHFMSNIELSRSLTSLSFDKIQDTGDQLTSRAGLDPVQKGVTSTHHNPLLGSRQGISISNARIGADMPLK